MRRGRITHPLLHCKKIDCLIEIYEIISNFFFFLQRNDCVELDFVRCVKDEGFASQKFVMDISGYSKLTILPKKSPKFADLNRYLYLLFVIFYNFVVGVKNIWC